MNEAEILSEQIRCAMPELGAPLTKNNTIKILDWLSQLVDLADPNSDTLRSTERELKAVIKERDELLNKKVAEIVAELDGNEEFESPSIIFQMAQRIDALQERHSDGQ